MEEKKRKKIIIIAIAILVILGVLFLIWRLSDRRVPIEPISEEDQPVFVAPSAPFQFDPNLPPAQTNTEFAVSELARNFAERFGSWSTDNLGSNLKELLPLSSPTMANYLNSIKVDDQAEEFYGISTKSLSANIVSLSPSQARVLVKTQRIQTQGNEEEVFYQDIEISLIKSGDSWLVSAANWK